MNNLILIALFSVAFAALWFFMQKKVVAMQEQMEASFKAISFDVMDKNGKQFLNLADATLQPIKETMKLLDSHQRELEKNRIGAYSGLSKQIDGLIHSEKELRIETAKLIQSLRSSQTRGAWGEVHLKRVVELAGLMNHCDFYEQQTLTAEGRILRPDLIVRLPGERQIAVDAKTPLAAYLEASETDDESVRKKKLAEHASVVRKHIKDLSSKEYWKLFETSPEFVVLFLPAESFFSAALQIDPSLIEVGADHNIIIATPTTLIAILRAVTYGWKQESLSQNARETAKLGAELYDRIGVVCDHWNKVGRSLSTAVDAFNQGVASLESRVLVSARKLKESSSQTKDLSSVVQIEKTIRTLQELNKNIL